MVSREVIFGTQPADPRVAAPATGGDTQPPLTLDTRGFAKPPRFSGRQEDWAAWAFRVESFGALCGWFEVNGACQEP